MTDILLIIVLLIVIAQLAVVFLLARFIGRFMNKIKSFDAIELKEADVGEPAPLFRSYTHEGEKVMLKEYLQHGKGVMLFFVNSTCMTCKSILADMQHSFSRDDVHVIFINGDEQADDDSLLQLLPAQAVYIRSSQMVELYGVTVVPQAILIDEQGIILQRKSLKNAKQFEQLLQAS
ncbi:antioxidant, AhpC/TSA family protein [Bacillus xiamenensis]|uniref:Redoxin domain-containing protein n=1 Tax=Bacillus xiamenensis TaxID=1178537 RepID=A0ABT4EZN4_9BACI|nr:redoxin domain-containing protein [Bacillus xiamenensis]MBG9913131.1 antioxidant, AhpC/TSA family protein [Bacillus xiamenensis]MCY9575254.1 redoxin domain-containing protein [Bacillus xiamenensis]